MQKIVFSWTLTEVNWNSRLIKTSIPEEIKQLKKEPRKHMYLGRAEIAATFMELDLIDEYRLYVHPVILGDGKPLIPQIEKSMETTLVENHVFESAGVVLLHYVKLPSI